MLERTGGKDIAPGRLNGSGPISIVDIGSNSVRLVVYERLARTPTMLFNEKVLAGLGRGVSKTGRLSDEAVSRALKALARFRTLSEHAGATEMHVIATAAARDSENGASFIRDAEAVLGTEIRVLSGRDEARFAALGVTCGVWNPDGIVGDLGGGSLELVSVSETSLGKGTTLPLGVLRLQDEAGSSMREVRRVAQEHLSRNKYVPKAAGKTLYLIGGTWRSLARLHMVRSNYPMQVMHHYAISAKTALQFCDEVMSSDIEMMEGAENVSRQRRPLLPHGAAVLSEVIRVTKPETIVLSSLGVREGLLFNLLDESVKAQDPLLAAAEELGYLRTRSPRHDLELIPWTENLLRVLGVRESDRAKRLRTAACLLSDIGWRAHPDYRGEQSFNNIAHADFVGIDHPGRAFLSACVFFRHVGLDESDLAPFVRALIDDQQIHQAKLIGIAFRIAYLLSASMPGILLDTRFVIERGALVLKLPDMFVNLDGERLRKRLVQLARLQGLEGEPLIEARKD